MAEVEPLPDNPTNADLVRALLQTHNCLDEHRAETKQNFHALALRVNEVESTTKSLDHSTKQILDALGIGNRKKNTIATMTQPEAFWKGSFAIAGGFVTFLLIVRGFLAAAPFLWDAVKAMFFAISGGALR